MSFREKSAWAMGALMLVTGLYYLELALVAGEVGWSSLYAIVPYTLAVIAGSIAIQVVLALRSRKDAARPADERERVAIDRAGHWSGLVLGFGAIGAALHYLWDRDGDLLFHLVIGSAIVAQLAEYAFQILLFRRGA